MKIGLDTRQGHIVQVWFRFVYYEAYSERKYRFPVKKIE